MKYLHQMDVLHEQLIRLGEQKRAAIVADEVDELTTLIQTETKLAKAVATIEQQWKQAAREWMEQRGIEFNVDLTISELAKYVHGDQERLDLLMAQRELSETLDRLKKLNDHNQQLLAQALSFVNYSLDLMTDIPDHYTYQNPDVASHRPVRKGIFDTKV